MKPPKSCRAYGTLGSAGAMTEPEQLTEPENTESVQPSAEYREALLVLDDTSYLHVQPCDTGWDYTLYDVATMKADGRRPVGRAGYGPFHSG